jgi:hypothetical protein
MALSAFGSAGGPVVGIFFLGAMFPQANWIVIAILHLFSDFVIFNALYFEQYDLHE